MPTCLVLPATEYVATDSEQVIRLPYGLTDDIEGNSAATRVMQALNDLEAAPDRVIGSDRSGALIWLLASMAYPKARLLWCDAGGSQPLDLGALKAHPEAPPPVPDKGVAKPVNLKGDAVLDAGRSSPRQETSPQRQATPPIDTSAMSDGRLVFEAFKFSAWGDTQAEHARQLESLEEEARRRAAKGNRAVLNQVVSAMRSGARAHELQKQLEQKLDAQGDGAELEDWLEKVCNGAHAKVREHLEVRRRKWNDRQASRRKRYQDGGGGGAHPGRQHTTLAAVELIDGHHPNSVLHLKASSQWEILIDETGSEFGEQADSLNAGDAKLGKVVALVVPQGVRLPELGRGFHATDATSLEVDGALRQVLQAPVGVFGFTVQDDVAGSRYWMAHIHQLVRWVMFQLPLRSDVPSRVKVMIEQRGVAVESASLAALSEVLESEFVQLDPQRYGQLRLSLEIIAKDGHPLNGYVDAVAFCWGSPAAVSRERLKRSQLLGHCLLRPSDVAMERLYFALNRAGNLRPADWYAVCAAAADEPAGGLMNSFLARLGETTRQSPDTWYAYLDVVRDHLSMKRFSLSELVAVLGWLERWQPDEARLPDTQRLRLETARLVLENHRGVVDPDRFGRCVELARLIHDELPHEACEAMLRLAVSTANCFQFGTMEALLDEWLDGPLAVAGILNVGKLHSTRGQLHAFQGRHAQAVASFDRGLELFSRLSDARQGARESAQTRIYRLIARMDDPATDAAAVIAEVVAHMEGQIRKASPDAISRSLASSGQALRFDHQLWLRTLIRFPEALRDARAAYLSASGQWQYGEDHPWPLIDAYRGWLLVMDDQAQRAQEDFNRAVSVCEAEAHGPTLRWMAEVLRTLAQALGVSLEAPASAAGRAQLARSFADAPHAALAAFAARAATPRMRHDEVLDALGQCLPFNFH